MFNLFGSLFFRSNVEQQHQQQCESSNSIESDEVVTNDACTQTTTLVSQLTTKSMSADELEKCCGSSGVASSAIQQGQSFDWVIVEKTINQQPVFTSVCTSTEDNNSVKMTDESSGAICQLATQPQKKRKTVLSESSSPSHANTTNNTSNNNIATSNETSPTSTMKRKGKKNKTACVSPATAAAVTAISPANKENMHARGLLMAELRKQGASTKIDGILANKNTMKRNNKLAVNKFNNNNIVQRKFHKLQQPAF